MDREKGMKKAAIIAMILALSGCMEAEPSLAMQQLNSACAAGDVNACGQVAQIEANNRAAMAAHFQRVGASMQQDPAMFQTSRRTAQTYCRPSFGGAVSCTTY